MGYLEVFLCSPAVVAQQSEIWFLDRSLCWHFLTATFTSYYRLMITHLGLPEWQYAFTPYGPSPQAKVERGPNNSSKMMSGNVLWVKFENFSLHFTKLCIVTVNL